MKVFAFLHLRSHKHISSSFFILLHSISSSLTPHPPLSHPIHSCLCLSIYLPVYLISSLALCFFRFYLFFYFIYLSPLFFSTMPLFFTIFLPHTLFLFHSSPTHPSHIPLTLLSPLPSGQRGRLPHLPLGHGGGRDGGRVGAQDPLGAPDGRRGLRLRGTHPRTSPGRHLPRQALCYR